MCKPLEHEENSWSWTKNPLCAWLLNSFFLECKFQICIQVFFDDLWYRAVFKYPKELSISGPWWTIYYNISHDSTGSTQLLSLGQKFLLIGKNVVRMPWDTEEKMHAKYLRKQLTFGYQPLHTTCRLFIPKDQSSLRRIESGVFVVSNICPGTQRFYSGASFFNGGIWYFENVWHAQRLSKTACGGEH